MWGFLGKMSGFHYLEGIYRIPSQVELLKSEELLVSELIEMPMYHILVTVYLE